MDYIDEIPKEISKNANAKAAWIVNQKKLAQFFQTQLFIAGLCITSSHKVMKTSKTTWKDAYHAIMDQDVTQNDVPIKKGPIVATHVT